MERREAPATSHAEKSGGRPTASSAKASERADGAVAGQTTAGTTVDAKSVAAAQAAQKGEQQQGHSHEDSKSSAPKDAANDPSQQSVPPVDPTAQVPVVAAVSEKGHSAGSQTQTSAPGANSTDVRVLKDSLPGVSQSQTTPKGSTSLGKSPVPTSKAAPTANSGGAATRAAGSSQSATGGFTGALTKATGEAALASQTTTATDGAGAGTGSTPRVQALATVSADGVQAVVTATGDTSKSSNTPSPPPSGSAAASSAAAATPTGTTTPNASAVGPSNGATYAANNSSQNPAGVGPSTVDRARFVQRVTRAFQTVGDQGGQIRLRLSPPELGSLDMQISVKDGGITAHIRADNSNARQLLLASLPDLRDRLAQQDIRIERFDVQLAGQSSGGMPQTPQDNPDFAQAGGRAGVGANSSTPSATADTSQAASGAITFTSGALNVVV
jgi:flagellar hook-length control protein FliK